MLRARRNGLETEIGRIFDLASLIKETTLEWSQPKDFLQASYPIHFAVLCTLPPDVAEAWERTQDGGGWSVQGAKGAKEQKLPKGEECFDWWCHSRDLDVLDQLKKDALSRRSELNSQESRQGKLVTENRFSALVDLDKLSDASSNDWNEDLPVWMQQLHNNVALRDSDSKSEASDTSDATEDLLPELQWEPPAGERTSDLLLQDPDLWLFSPLERARILRHWADTIVAEQTPVFSQLRTPHRKTKEEIEELSSQARLQVLCNSEVIAGTANL